MFKYVLFTAAGVAIGYYVAQTRLEDEYERKLDLATQEAKYHYRDFYKKKSAEEGETPEFTEAAIDAAEALQEYAGVTVGPDILTREMTATVERAVERGDLTVEESSGDEWDHSREEHEAEKHEAEKLVEPPTPMAAPPVKVRGLVKDAPKAPAVNYNHISTPPKASEEVKTESEKAAEMEPEGVDVEFINKHAFIDNQFGYKQFSFTYFAGDDVLANEEDEPVTGAAREGSVGKEALRKLKIGREAMDGENTVYVRNRTGHWEFEVTRSGGKFSDEVAAGPE